MREGGKFIARRMLTDLTARLLTGLDLSGEMVDAAVAQLISAEVPDGAKGDFLKALRAKGETAAELIFLLITGRRTP